MSTPCTRCEGSGFLNLGQINDKILIEFENSLDCHDAVNRWIADNINHDVQICDCCGDGDYWYGTPGEHYNSEDQKGQDGPYAYNGGLCECN